MMSQPTGDDGAAVSVPGAPRGRRRRRRSVVIVTGVAAALAAAGFLASASAFGQAAPGAATSAGAGAGLPASDVSLSSGAACAVPLNGRVVSGTLTAVNGSTLTVHAKDGRDETVTTTPSTRVIRAQDGTLGDIHNGDTVFAGLARWPRWLLDWRSCFRPPGRGSRAVRPRSS